MCIREIWGKKKEPRRERPRKGPERGRQTDGQKEEEIKGRWLRKAEGRKKFTGVSRPLGRAVGLLLVPDRPV